MASEKTASSQPALQDLLARYLQQKAAACAAGFPEERTGDVTPFEAAPVQPVDARLAWEEAVTVLGHFQLKIENPTVPPDWSGLAASQDSPGALAFAVGNFPQLIRNWQPLWQTADLGLLRPGEGRPAVLPALAGWVEKQNAFPGLLLGVGLLRLARQFTLAERLIREHGSAVPKAWRVAWANEEAALCWHRGKFDEARKLWRDLPDSIPVLFNRGMAALFCQKPAEARPALEQAAAGIPEASAWHHLARLYLTLAEVRK